MIAIYEQAAYNTVHYAWRETLADNCIPPSNEWAAQTIEPHHGLTYKTAAFCCRGLKRRGHVRTTVNVLVERAEA